MADIYEIKPGTRQAEKRLQDASDATEEANETLLETLSHDLRTPLNTIIGFADMMDQEILGPLTNPHYREYVEVISTEGRRMLDFINDLLNRKRFEKRRPSPFCSQSSFFRGEYSGKRSGFERYPVYG